MEDGTDVQHHIRRIKLFNTNKNLMPIICLWLFRYLHHFFHNALEATDIARGISSGNAAAWSPSLKALDDSFSMKESPPTGILTLHPACLFQYLPGRLRR